MATRKIKDAKDLATDELIYFKGHAKATFMSDGRSVEDVIKGLGSAYPTIEVSAADSLVLQPNTYYIATDIADGKTLAIDFANPVDGVVSEYVVELHAGSGFSLSFPESVVWADGNIPAMAAGKVYVVSIINNLAVFAEF